MRSESIIRVRYAETDQMGVAHHGRYAAWFEVGRVDFMNALGVPYREVERGGVFLVVTGLHVTFRRPAFFDDELRLTTRVALVKSRMARFEYRLERVADSSLLAEGATEHVATNLERRTVPIPAFLREALEAAASPS